MKTFTVKPYRCVLRRLLSCSMFSDCLMVNAVHSTSLGLCLTIPSPRYVLRVVLGTVRIRLSHHRAEVLLAWPVQLQKLGDVATGARLFSGL